MHDTLTSINVLFKQTKAAQIYLRKLSLSIAYTKTTRQSILTGAHEVSMTIKKTVSYDIIITGKTKKKITII